MKELKDAEEDSKEESNKKEFHQLYTNEAVVKSIIIQKNATSLLEHWSKSDVQKKDLLVIATNRDFLDIYENEFNATNPRYALISDETAFRRRVKRNRVILDDKFEKQSRNSDYQEEDKFFSEDHLYFEEDGLKGFSDYSVVGSDYKESGFAPYAVAIHIVFFAKKRLLNEGIIQKKTPAGYINVSSPELTAFDLLENIHRFGINRITTVLQELYEEMRGSRLSKIAKLIGNKASIQRLGYILDTVVNEENLADSLYKILNKTSFSSVPLSPQKGRKGEIDSKWKLIINMQIESDL
jgi:hypothetical protein